jgi:hypothetical protein
LETVKRSGSGGCKVSEGAKGRSWAPKKKSSCWWSA